MSEQERNTCPNKVFGGILAAGAGARFQAAGVKTPKALVELAGRSLLLRSLDAFREAAHERVAVVVNDAVAPAVRAHLASHGETRVDLTVKTTGSTLETFEVLIGAARAAGAERFLFTTVDAVTPGELARFAREAEADPSSLALGVAPVEPDDEGPLRVELDAARRARLGKGPYATSGFYAGLVSETAMAVTRARSAGVPSLRFFLLQEGERTVVRGIVLARALDVDTPRDVEIAERALHAWRGHRHPPHSPAGNAGPPP